MFFDATSTSSSAPRSPPASKGLPVHGRVASDYNDF
jgi:hypothetical protein